MFQANLLVAMLGGFWARTADGSPGPDLLGRGLRVLNLLVNWERVKKEGTPNKTAAKAGRCKPG